MSAPSVGTVGWRFRLALWAGIALLLLAKLPLAYVKGADFAERQRSSPDLIEESETYVATVARGHHAIYMGIYLTLVVVSTALVVGIACLWKRNRNERSATKIAFFWLLFFTITGFLGLLLDPG